MATASPAAAVLASRRLCRPLAQATARQRKGRGRAAAAARVPPPESPDAGARRELLGIDVEHIVGVALPLPLPPPLPLNPRATPAPPSARTWILWSLVESNALGSNFRRNDHFEEEYVPKKDESAESKKMTESTQMLGVGAVLVAAVTFAVAFSPPGGYGGDGGGAPALAGQYPFDAFMYAVAIAFAYSMLATFSLMYSSTAAVDWKLRRAYFERSLAWMRQSTRSLLVAFALGVYLVLAPVSRTTAIGIMVSASGTLFLRNREVLRMLMCAYVLHKRMGIMVLARIGVPMAVVLLQSSLIFVVIFGAPLCPPLCLLVFVGKLVHEDVSFLRYVNGKFSNILDALLNPTLPTPQGV
uniref:Expressed protein n=2 Tax=Oryza sativa subsp. japonica TaxID=39947 RepID=Q53LR0_ORYSJ|nr:hypothetical protein LOC_Os11g09200 [Oryza sativa Japonica Group]ABA91931.1 expressed protein [Oryza sativa Japonica Group]